MVFQIDTQSILVYVIVVASFVFLVRAFVRPFGGGGKAGCSKCSTHRPPESQRLLQIESVSDG